MSGDALMLGPVRQEILSGVKDTRQFEQLRKGLSPFEDEPILTNDYELAASLFNRCRAKGIQGLNTDFLICAVAIRIGVPVFTLDRDFKRYAEVVPLRLA